MNEIEIRKVTSLKDLKRFVDFPFQLFKGNACWVPPLKSGEIKTLLINKNPAFEFCESGYWMAFRSSEPVGRIAGIINQHENERWDSKLVRFGWIDFIDDQEVSKALLDTVISWGRSKGMTGIHGPMGFNNMDAEGMLTEGFDELSSLSAIYNYAYYCDHMEKMDFRKSADLVQYEVRVPAEIPDKVERLTRIVMEKFDLRILKLRKSKDLLLYAHKIFDLYNESFYDLYGFTALSEKQIDYYTNKYMRFIRPEFVSLLVDSKDDVVGFGITMPSLSRAIQKTKGSLLPFGFIHLLRAMKNNDIIQMYLVGVRPDYQGKGILALIYHELTKTYIEKGIRITLTQPQLEDNLKAVAIWKNYESRVNIRRRVWIKEI